MSGIDKLKKQLGSQKSAPRISKKLLHKVEVQKEQNLINEKIDDFKREELARYDWLATLADDSTSVDLDQLLCFSNRSLLRPLTQDDLIYFKDKLSDEQPILSVVVNYLKETGREPDDVCLKFDKLEDQKIRSVLSMGNMTSLREFIALNDRKKFVELVKFLIAYKRIAHFLTTSNILKNRKTIIENVEQYSIMAILSYIKGRLDENFFNDFGISISDELMRQGETVNKISQSFLTNADKEIFNSRLKRLQKTTDMFNDTSKDVFFATDEEYTVFYQKDIKENIEKAKRLIDFVKQNKKFPAVTRLNVSTEEQILAYWMGRLRNIMKAKQISDQIADLLNDKTWYLKEYSLDEIVDAHKLSDIFPNRITREAYISSLKNVKKNAKMFHFVFKDAIAIIEDGLGEDWNNHSVDIDRIHTECISGYANREWITGYIATYVKGIEQMYIVPSDKVVYQGSLYTRAHPSLDLLLCSAKKEQSGNILTIFYGGQVYKVEILYKIDDGHRRQENGLFKPHYRYMVQDESIYELEKRWVEEKNMNMAQLIHTFLEKSMQELSSLHREKMRALLIALLKRSFSEKDASNIEERFYKMHSQGKVKVYLYHIGKLLLFTTILKNVATSFNQRLEKSYYNLYEITTLGLEDILNEYDMTLSFQNQIEDELNSYILSISHDICAILYKKGDINEVKISSLDKSPMTCSNQIDESKWNTIYYKDDDHVYCISLLELFEQFSKKNVTIPGTNKTFKDDFVKRILAQFNQKALVADKKDKKDNVLESAKTKVFRALKDLEAKLGSGRSKKRVAYIKEFGGVFIPSSVGVEEVKDKEEDNKEENNKEEDNKEPITVEIWQSPPIMKRPIVPTVEDPYRLRLIDLLKRAIRLHDEKVEDVKLDQITREIEYGIYESSKNSKNENDYRENIRRILSALKRLSNDLAKRLINGLIDPLDVYSMTDDQLSSSDTQTFIKAIDIEQKAASRSDNILVSGMKTDEFKCSKCKKRNTVYTQKQTRSADEPMTLFIRCLECGNEWKQSG